MTRPHPGQAWITPQLITASAGTETRNRGTVVEVDLSEDKTNLSLDEPFPRWRWQARGHIRLLSDWKVHVLVQGLLDEIERGQQMDKCLQERNKV
eukprot:3348155-Amphidinium_carterae.1